VQALDQGLDADHDAVAIRGHRVRDAVSGVDVQKKILTIQPASSRALGQPRYAVLRVSHLLLWWVDAPGLLVFRSSNLGTGACYTGR
jgi:hypothetical protein